MEFISRGCTDIVSVDKEGRCIKFVSETQKLLEAPGAIVFKSDALSFLERNTRNFDLIFADPPYEYSHTPKIPDLIFSKKFLNKNGWLIVEHGATQNFEDHDHFRELRIYGNVRFSIFEDK